MYPAVHHRATLGRTSKSAPRMGRPKGSSGSSNRRTPERWLLLATAALVVCALGLSLPAVLQIDAALTPGTRTALLLAALLAAALLGWAAWDLKRQHGHLRRIARQASSDLESGAWQDAVRSLRDRPSGCAVGLRRAGHRGRGCARRVRASLADPGRPGGRLVLGNRRTASPGLDVRRRPPDRIAGPAAGRTDRPAPRPDRGLRAAGRRLGTVPCACSMAGAPSATWSSGSCVCMASAKLRSGSRSAAARGATPKAASRGYEGVGRDITERKQAHERLRASEQRWTLMAGLASDYYWETDDRASHAALAARGRAPLRASGRGPGGPHALGGLSRRRCGRRAGPNTAPTSRPGARFAASRWTSNSTAHAAASSR